MSTLGLKLFGGFELTGASAARLPTRKAEALLAYLAIPAGRAHRRAKLASMLWGDRGDAQSRHSLAQTLYLLRKSLQANGDGPVIVESRSVALDPSGVDVDVNKFEVLAAQQTPDALEEAAALYQGELLEGFEIREEAFEIWLLGEQRRLHEVALNALENLLHHHLNRFSTWRSRSAAAWS